MITSSQNRYCSSKAPQDDINISFSLKEMFQKVENTQEKQIKMLKENNKISLEATKAELRAENSSEFRAMLMHMKILIGIGLLLIGNAAAFYMS
ncbi:unnamed protein product [Auanema sp. JU1783]|nr:unnamed protein product [Auanema sp. JU1783]